jgi:hypothetical protein
MSFQDQLISAMQNNNNAKARASIMKVLAEQGDEVAIRPMLLAICVQPLLNTNLRNDGNTQMDAALKLCQRHKDKAETYLVEVLNEPAPTSSKFIPLLFDADYRAAVARKSAAAHILGVLYGGEESLAGNLFANAKKVK